MPIINRVLLPVTVLSIAHCAQKTDCRKYAEQIVLSTGARIDCSFNEKKAEYRCASGGVSTVYAYTGLDEFIDESRVIGRRRWVGSQVSGAVTEQTINGFADDKRLLSTVKTSGSAMITYTSQEWDGYQRPVRISSNHDSGTGNTCLGRIETAQIDDAARTITVNVSYASSTGTGIYAGSPCAGTANTTTVYRFDSDAEMIGAGSTNYSILKKGEVCQ